MHLPCETIAVLQYHKKDNIMSFQKDEKTQAVLNTDVSALNKYKIERTYYRKVDNLTTDILEIKRSLITIWEKIEEVMKFYIMA